jgi:hypothetical protein
VGFGRSEAVTQIYAGDEMYAGKRGLANIACSLGTRNIAAASPTRTALSKDSSFLLIQMRIHLNLYSARIHRGRSDKF